MITHPAFAQLAPTGEHYAGRPTDTGFGGTFSDATGTFSAAVPLDLPASRDKLPIPLQIAYGAQSMGAAGVGWDVPLSYLRQDSIFAYRRPSSVAGTPPTPRQRTTLSLFGQSSDLVLDGNTWVARSGTLELAVQQSGNVWLAYDGNGRTYSFEQPSSLSSTGLWLLSSISGPDAASGASVKLTYQIQNNLPLNGGAASGLSIDLTQIDYNFLPPTRPFTPPGCAKDEIALTYQTPNTVTNWYQGIAAPLSLSVLGNTLLVRQTTLATVDVRSRIQCRDPFVSLRRYVLQYAPDKDTQLPRLQKVQMSGRYGTPEAATSRPVANYQYGSATDNWTLRYEHTLTIPIPAIAAAAAAGGMAGTVLDSSVKNPGSASDVGYAMWLSLTDVTGDGRPDLVFKHDNKLWVAYNRPGTDGATTLGATAQTIAPLSDATFSKGAFSTQTSVKARYHYQPSANRNTTDIWREAIDVNGDGRIDIIDAAEEPNQWVVYLNTPGPNGSVTWVRRSFSVVVLEGNLNAMGHHLDGPYLPLSRRSTGFDLHESLCWQWNGSNWELDPNHFGNTGCPGQQEKETYGPEQTFVEWDLIDINGDGYPDFVFDSTPVDWYSAPPACPFCQPNHTSWQEVPAGLVAFGPQQQDGLLRSDGSPQPKKNDILVAYNVAGVRFDLDQNVFSSSVSVSAPAPTLGVSMWSCLTAACDQQTEIAGFADVNGDRLVDRVDGESAYLGTGGSFSKAYILLPGYLENVVNNEAQICHSGEHPQPQSNQTGGLRDLTGDGIPDYFTQAFSATAGPVWIATGTGFVGPVAIQSPTFVWSHQTESCDGSGSWTDGGLFDIDGDGRPEVVTTVGSDFWVFQLVGGQGPGRPEAGRLTQLDNGYGAVTQISYTSAKLHTDNSVPFPENVVAGVTETGANNLGGSLAGSRFAYGNGALVFDTALDRFIFPGYGRSVDLELFDVAGPIPPVLGSGKAVGLALITDRAGLEPFSQVMSQHDRWLREKQVGQVSQAITVHDITTTDPWGLLDTPALAQFVTSATEVTWDANYYETPPPANWNPLDCFEMFLPYDYAQSFASNGGTQGIDSCRSHGFAHPIQTTSWRGTSSPPSDQNVQTATQVLSVDDYGHPLQLQLSNDVFRSDDDLCVENVYATNPNGTFPRVVHALASRRLSTLCSNAKSVMLAYDSWNFDNLPSGAVSSGLVTSHSLERHATDSGALVGAVHAYDATYDGFGNISTIRTSRGAATRTLTFTFDPFALVPTQTRVDATGVPSQLITTAYDPLSLQLSATTDINGTVRGLAFDGFDRPVRSTLTPPGGNPGVLSTISYLGFDGTDPAGRRMSVTGFADPVDPAQISTAIGETVVTYLDELGRERRTELALGSDYTNQTLVIGARTYDGVGRLSFRADTYLKGATLRSAYGMSYFYTPDGDLNCLIRGTGPQELTYTSDLAAERFPTCLSHSFASHTEIFDVHDASSLLQNSPQAGVAHRTVRTAIGRILEQSTVSSTGVRLEDATFSYDHLGQLEVISRYLDPSGATFPTQWIRRLDSLGQVIQFDEPTAPTRFFDYSDWGEPIETRWNIGVVAHQLLQNFDSLSRVTGYEERSNGLTDAQTVITYSYDSGINASPLVAPTFVLGHLAGATSVNGRVAFSYDVMGQPNAEVFTDNVGGLYVQKVTRHANGLLNTLEFDLPDRGYNPETATYGYDSANRLRSVNYSDSSGTVPLYTAGTIDVLGRVRNAQYGSGVTYHADYAASGREMITGSGVSSPFGSRLITFGPFDPMDREASRQEFANGAVAGTETDSAYDALGQLASVKISAGGSTLFNWQFTYDALGNISRMIDVGNNAAAVLLSTDPNDRDRLCRIDYGLPQPRQESTCNVLHDGLGNVVAEPTRAGTRQFTYFASSRVRAIEAGGAQAAFSYGPFGDWQTLDVQGTPAQEWHERRYGLIDWRNLNNGSSTQAMLSRSVPGPGGLVASRRGPGNDWIFAFSEPRGQRFFTNLAGAFVQTIDYQPFGAANSQGATPTSGDYSSQQWNGADALAASGLSQLGARTYDPVIGRFLSRDPLVAARTASSSNPYAFAANDPVNRADPTGLDFSGCDDPDCSSISGLPTEPGGGGGSGGKTAGQTGTPAPPAPVISNGPITLLGMLLRDAAVSVNGTAPPGYDFDSIAATSRDWSSTIHTLDRLDYPERDAYINADTAHIDEQEEIWRARGLMVAGGALAVADLAPAAVFAVRYAASSVLLDAGYSATAAAVFPTVAPTAVEVAAGAAGAGVAVEEEQALATEATGSRAQTLFHYTSESGLKGILQSGQLNPSLKALNPADARYGNGQYLSDIIPGTRTLAQLSREFLGAPFWGSRFTHFVEIDVTGLEVLEGRPGVFLIPNEEPLDIAGRIFSFGASQ